MFYRCEKCDSIFAKIINGRGEMRCCGEVMRSLKAQKADGEHSIFADCSGDNVTVTVGEHSHPMDSEHRIVFIALQTRDRIFIRKLNNVRKASTKFSGINCEFKIYAYCSSHGLFCDRTK